MAKRVFLTSLRHVNDPKSYYSFFFSFQKDITFSLLSPAGHQAATPICFTNIILKHKKRVQEKVIKWKIRLINNVQVVHNAIYHSKKKVTYSHFICMKHTTFGRNHMPLTKWSSIFFLVLLDYMSSITVFISVQPQSNGQKQIQNPFFFRFGLEILLFNT